MTTIVVEQPNNDIMVGMSEHNPYKKLDQNVETLEEPLTSNNVPHRVYFGASVIRLNPEDLNRAVRLQNYAHIIRIVCIMDFFMSMMNFFMLMNPYFFLAGIFNLIGLRGITQFDKIQLYTYGAYQFILAVGLGVTLGFYISHENNVIIVMSSVGIVFHLWMLKIVKNFIDMFPV